MSTPIAEVCLAVYRSLPKNGKPFLRDNGQPEWTVLSGFVISRPVTGQDAVLASNQIIQSGTLYECVSLGCFCLEDCLQIYVSSCREKDRREMLAA